MGAFAAGCALTWSSPSLGKLEEGTANGLKIGKAESSWVGSLTPLGAAVGPLLAGALLDRFGRKNTVLFGMVLSAISWIMIATVPILNALYFARLLAGVAVGIIFTAVPMYIAEIAEVGTLPIRVLPYKINKVQIECPAEYFNHIIAISPAISNRDFLFHRTII